MSATLDKANANTGNIRVLNLAVVKHTTDQVTRLLLSERAPHKDKTVTVKLNLISS
jgi:hypothetical protein